MEYVIALLNDKLKEEEYYKKCAVMNKNTREIHRSSIKIIQLKRAIELFDLTDSQKQSSNTNKDTHLSDINMVLNSAMKCGAKYQVKFIDYDDYNYTVKLKITEKVIENILNHKSIKSISIEIKDFN